MCSHKNARLCNQEQRLQEQARLQLQLAFGLEAASMKLTCSLAGVITALVSPLVQCAKKVYIMSLHEHVYGVCINNVSIHVDSKTVCMQHGVFPSE